MKRRLARALAIAACVSGLASCGGGGGGSSGPSLTVTADRSSFQFVGFTTAPPSAQNVNFTLVSADSGGKFYGQVVPDRPTEFSASFTPTSNTTAVVTITPAVVQPGTRSGSFTFRLCSDVNCNSVAWSQTIPYTYAVYSVDTTGLTLNGYEGAALPPANIAVSPVDTAHVLSISSSMSSGAGWLSVAPSASGIAVTATGATVKAGSYQGEVKVSLADRPDGPRLTVPISFTVGDGIVAPPAATANLDGNATLASMAATAPVDFRGVQAPNWTASSDQPWLVLNGASGTGAGQLHYAVDPSKAGAVPNWSSATAHVKISAPGLTDASFPVTLNKKLPEIYTVSPSVIRAGTAGTVRVTGRGLSQLSNASQIQVGSLTGITGSITSDTSATLTLPALPAGRTAISIANAAGTATFSTAIGAANIGALTAATASTSGDKRSSLFDPTRNALFAINLSQNTLLRFTFAGGQWQASGLPVASIGDMAMAPDWRTLYVVSGDSTLLAIDPDTLQIQSSYTAPAEVTLYGGSLKTGWFRTRGMPATSNQRIWIGGNNRWGPMRYFDLLSASFGTVDIPNVLLNGPSYFASGDGSTMFVAQGLLSPPLPNYVYSTATNTATQVPGAPTVGWHVMFSDDASRALVDNTSLYKMPGFMLAGTTPGGIFAGTTAVLSPDGRRVYRLMPAGSGSSSIVIDHVDIYDATQVNTTTSEMVKLGQIAVTSQATACGSQPYYGCDGVGSFTISPLGDTLFWIGNQQLVSLPIPSAMSGIQSGGPRLLPAATR